MSFSSLLQNGWQYFAGQLPNGTDLCAATAYVANSCEQGYALGLKWGQNLTLQVASMSYDSSNPLARTTPGSLLANCISPVEVAKLAIDALSSPFANNETSICIADGFSMGNIKLLAAATNLTASACESFKSNYFPKSENCYNEVNNPALYGSLAAASVTIAACGIAAIVKVCRDKYRVDHAKENADKSTVRHAGFYSKSHRQAKRHRHHLAELEPTPYLTSAHRSV